MKLYSARWIAGGGVICLLCGMLVVAGCSKSDAPAGDAAQKGGKKGGKGGRGGGGPVPVVAAKVTRRDVPIEVTAVGNVEAYSTVSILAQIGGQLNQVYFNEGDYVNKGAKLFEIDPSLIEAQVAQAEANMARDQALLAQSEANLARDAANEKYARDQAGRYGKLFEEGVVSREQGEQFNSNADALANSVRADRAAVDSIKAQIKADEANIRNLKAQLAYTVIYAPITGKTGNLTVKQGNIVVANQTVLMNITQVQPIYVTFSVPETHFADIRRYMAQSKLAVEAIPQDGSLQQPAQGELTFVDNNVDTTTGTIKLKGTFGNANRALWPGEYVNVVLRMAVRQNALVVPNQAVQTGQDGSYVYVVNEDNSVAMRPVVSSARVDQDLVIDKGLKDGETVVTEGQLRLAEGSRVQITGPNGPGGGGRGRDGGGRAGRAGGADEAAAGASSEAGGKGFRNGGREGDGAGNGRPGQAARGGDGAAVAGGEGRGNGFGKGGEGRGKRGFKGTGGGSQGGSE
ncbi:MAG TPA: efflux RND transporter periplasmic adaptor subunit [Bryobacteraceae bacterium]|nr:efflux RND transporter periplasmic adaptor subunit [Bryobacteraceae bacterium]